MKGGYQTFFQGSILILLVTKDRMQSFKIVAFLLHDFLWLETKQDNNLAKLEASLAPAEAEFGALAKADQY